MGPNKFEWKKDGDGNYVSEEGNIINKGDDKLWRTKDINGEIHTFDTLSKAKDFIEEGGEEECDDIYNKMLKNINKQHKVK